MKKFIIAPVCVILFSLLIISCEKKDYRCYCYLPGDTTGYSHKFFYFDNTSKFWADKQCDIIVHRVQKIFPDYSCILNPYQKTGNK